MTTEKQEIKAMRYKIFISSVQTDAFVTIIYRKNSVAFEKVGGQIGGQITDAQKKVLNLIIEDKRITRKEIANRISINESAIQKQLEKLKQLGILERVGGTRGYWKIKGGGQP